MDFAAVQKKYRDMLEGDFLPFWEKAFDREYGGVFTCFSNDGSRLLSQDKYVWSQGRILWVLARLCDMSDRGRVAIDRGKYARQAEQTYCLIRDHAVLEKGGVCAYLLDREGRPKESIPGKGFYTSYLVDCFVIIGVMEYARVFRRADAVALGLELYDRMQAYLGRGDVRAEPYPVRKGYRAHSMEMILCNVCGTAADALRASGHPREPEMARAARLHAHRVLFGFYDPRNGLIREMVGPPQESDTVLARHVTPGHMNECMWFCMDAYREGTGGESLAARDRIASVVLRNMESNWDEKFGGLCRFLDRDGTPPHGRRIGDAYENLVLDTWDTKLWWVHSESLYTVLRSYCVTGRPEFADWYDRLDDYVFAHFPNPDRRVGEWIQILDRRGRPLEKVVALPVKDPFHILRDMMQILELSAPQF